MARITPTTAQLAELANTHLYYEVAMLRGALAEQDKRRAETPHIRDLDRDDPIRIACMAFFEAALIHARVLDDFLTLPPPNSGRNADDIWAGDYVPNWQPPNPSPLDRANPVVPGQKVRDSINKQLAHFSVLRLQQTAFYVGRITAEVLHDLKLFAEDTNNVCYQELQGVRDLINRAPWRTET
ncbi:hypothetical protein AO501_20100 [Mycobacterium gordonae]|uniref:Uncharacterized protein n=1 Tax=Mycobacterium gordonae TaxID=1778 RepID=A0A0Q2XA26_MYCGO|nr:MULTISPECIES: hypothetical protein [Mycobacterium]KQH78060.1 hypothetical protein AO501_20100 [Mycobacterium gordonae]MDP7726865.1 hypothetical protein [Mycobacterium sp. TY813]